MIFLILTAGIFLHIASANSWFIVPEICYQICYGISGVLLVLVGLQHLFVRKITRKF